VQSIAESYFERELTEDELDAVAEYLHHDGLPGWADALAAVIEASVKEDET
jgi:hypothetical protein